MAKVLDVAAYILNKQGPMTAMKLQKLVYYSQAWTLVWDEKPLYRNHIEAWANGPVIPALYKAHRGLFRVGRGTVRGNAARLIANEKETIDAVLRHYGGKSSHWLSELTHSERPWKSARKGLEPGERSNQEITQAAMAEYYGGL